MSTGVKEEVRQVDLSTTTENDLTTTTTAATTTEEAAPAASPARESSSAPAQVKEELVLDGANQADEASGKKSKKEKKEKKEKKDKKDKKDKKSKKSQVKEEQDAPSVGVKEDDRFKMDDDDDDDDINLMDEGVGMLDDESEYEEGGKKSKKKKSKKSTKKRKRNNYDDEDEGMTLTEYSLEKDDKKPKEELKMILDTDTQAQRFEKTLHNQRVRQRKERSLDDESHIANSALQTSVRGIVGQMLAAARKDLLILDFVYDLHKQGNYRILSHVPQAMNRVTLFPHIVRDLRKSKTVLEAFVQEDLLLVLRLWLTPDPNGTLLQSAVREEIYKILASLPTLSAEHINRSGLGATLLHLYRHPDETQTNKAVLGKILEEWTRIVLGVGGAYRTSAVSYANRDVDTPDQQAKLDLLRQQRQALEDQSIMNLPSTDTDRQRARRPMGFGMQFLVAPTNNAAELPIEKPRKTKGGKAEKEEKKSTTKKRRNKHEEEMERWMGSDGEDDNVTKEKLQEVMADEDYSMDPHQRRNVINDDDDDDVSDF